MSFHQTGAPAAEGACPSTVRPAHALTGAHARHVVAIALALSACRSRHDAPIETRSKAAVSATANALASASPATTSAPKRNAEPAPPTPLTRAAADHARFTVDPPVAIGPAGPATAHARGIVMVDRKDAVLLAARDAHSANVATIAPVERSAEDFARYGKGPAVVGDYAFWISKNRLLRAKLDGSAPFEVLAEDARNGTRVAAADPWVAYITQPDREGAAHAKLWTGHGPALELTAEGAATSSLELVSTRGGWMAVSLDGRTSMTPLHARRLVRGGTGVVPGVDVVSWVGGPAQGTTEVSALSVDGDVWAFVPIEQDITHFGLAQVHLGAEPGVDATVTFITYENGINTAPVATAVVCGQPSVAFVAPAGKGQELLIARLGASGLEPAEVIARAHAFYDVSLAAVGNGALIAYTAERRTHALGLRCKKS